jgi:uncharacterized RDD family membrane protein YckC
MLVDGRLAGFWIRLASDLIDAIVLGAIGYVIVLLFRGSVLRLGERAALIGAPVTLVYMGVLQSHIGGGRTLAKRWLGLRVLRLDGQYLSLDRSLVRWALMGVLSYGSAIGLAVAGLFPRLPTEALGAAIFGAQVSLALGCGLLVAFHPLKRGLHDLLTGSIVIRGGKVPTELIARLHKPQRDRRFVLAAVAVALVVSIAGLNLGRKVASQVQPNARVANAMTEMGIGSPGVLDSMVTTPSGTFHQIIVTGYLPTTSDGAPLVQNAQDRILALVRADMPLEGVDSIIITLRSGVNVGIYSSYESTTRRERATPNADATAAQPR